MDIVPALRIQTNTPVNLQLKVEQISGSSPLGLWIVLALTAIALVVIIYVFYRQLRKPSPQRSIRPISLSEDRQTASGAKKPLSRQAVVVPSKHTPEPKLAELPPEVEKYLKEDERIVLRVLQMKGGSASQGTLRVATNFSKAKLSRVLTELEQRGVVHKDKEGKKNLVSMRF